MPEGQPQIQTKPIGDWSQHRKTPYSYHRPLKAQFLAVPNSSVVAPANGGPTDLDIDPPVIGVSAVRPGLQISNEPYWVCCIA